MPTLVWIDVQYLQDVVFSFEKRFEWSKLLLARFQPHNKKIPSPQQNFPSLPIGGWGDSPHYPLTLFGRSCTRTTLNKLLCNSGLSEIIQKCFESKQIVSEVFTDLGKAFDIVDVILLLNKLSYYGISGITNRWFQSYLSHHTQYVSISGFNSNHKPMKYGVPQGSVLETLLFLIFITDLNFAIENSRTFHFAHDTCLLNAN